MGKTGFEKATSKMFGDFGSAVRIAVPEAGRRPSKEERERMREEVAEADSRKEREERVREQKDLVQTLVDMKVIPPASLPEAAAPEVEESRRGRGRPAKNPEVEEYVLMNFRVGADFRQRLKVMAAQEGKSVTALFDEAFALLFEKYGE